MAAQGLPHEPQDSAVKLLPVKACETFEHPCFPKLCEESLAENYASSLGSLADHPPFLDLTLERYDATDLQDATCAGFLSGERYPHQLMAKSAFLKWYSKQFAPRAFDGPPHIDIHLTTSPPSAQRKIFFRDSLREIIRMFDDYFFFGTLTRHRPGCLRPLVRLDAGNDLLKTHISPDRIYCGGICKGSSEFGYPYSEVAVFEALHDHSGPIYYASLQFAIRTLLHELLHAYIDVFICTCACCKKDIPNTRGFTGHGKTFLRMNTLMMEELRSWHPDFTAWWPYDLHGGFFFPLVSFREEEDEYRKWRSLPHFGRLNPLIQEDSPEKLVRMEINDRGTNASTDS
ncbi:hypothetical protein RB213_004002 [Colletotrichum asianum]